MITQQPITTDNDIPYGKFHVTWVNRLAQFRVNFLAPALNQENPGSLPVRIKYYFNDKLCKV